jgi:RND family efflux transporter MFP subunit
MTEFVGHRGARTRYRSTLAALSMAGVAWMIGLAGCGHEAPEEVKTETVVPVTTEPATTGSIRTVIHATGIVEPAPGAELIVTAPDPARIAAITKAEGDSVRRGEVLVRFEIPTLGAEEAAKHADVARAEARLQNARAAQQRAHDLFERGVAARKEVEDADRELAEAQAAVGEAQAARGAASTLASRTTVHATFDGVVAKRFHNPGDQVEAAASDPVLRVIDPRRLEAHASIPITDVPQVVVGASGRLVVAAGMDPIPLKVISRPASVEAGTASVPVRLAVIGQSRLASGTPVQIEIDGDEHTNVVLVPVAAIVREGNETAVFVAIDGKAQRRVIEPGFADREHVEVRSGVKAGEQIITQGQAGLPDGTAITVGGAGKEAPEKGTPEKAAPDKAAPKK